MTTRKKYSKEFKLDAISLVTDQGYSRVEAARSLGINANMLCRWVQEERIGDGQAFETIGDRPRLMQLWFCQIRRSDIQQFHPRTASNALSYLMNPTVSSTGTHVFYLCFV